MLTASVIEIEELSFSDKNLENNLSKIGINKTIDNIEYYVYTLIDPTGASNVELTFE